MRSWDRREKAATDQRGPPVQATASTAATFLRLILSLFFELHHLSLASESHFGSSDPSKVAARSALREALIEGVRTLYETKSHLDPRRVSFFKKPTLIRKEPPREDLLGMRCGTDSCITEVKDLQAW